MENLIAEDPILVGEKRLSNANVDDGRMHLALATANSRALPSQKVDASEGEQAERKKGSSGWMKLKSRPEG